MSEKRFVDMDTVVRIVKDALTDRTQYVAGVMLQGRVGVNAWMGLIAQFDKEARPDRSRGLLQACEAAHKFVLAHPVGLDGIPAEEERNKILAWLQSDIAKAKAEPALITRRSQRVKKHTPGDVWADGSFVMAGDYASEGEPDMLVEVRFAEFPEVDAERIAAAWSACEGIPTEHLQPGAVKALVEALSLYVQAAELEMAADHPLLEAHQMRTEGWVKARAALAPFKGAQELDTCSKHS